MPTRKLAIRDAVWRFLNRNPSAIILLILPIPFLWRLAFVWDFVGPLLCALTLLLLPLLLLLPYRPLLLLMRRHAVVRQLLSARQEVRRRAFEQLLQREEAVPILIGIVQATPRDEASGQWAYIEAICLAAEGLGRLRAREGVEALLEATQDFVPDIRATALWALGQIGDPRAVPAAIALLTDKSRLNERRCGWLTAWAQEALQGGQSDDGTPTAYAGAETVGMVAAAVLAALGQGEVVKAFWQALRQRDEKAVRQLRALREYRKALVEALVRMVQEGTVSEAVNAAWLLGAMGAVEALPMLRAKARALTTAERVREECQRAIKALEMLAVLPMPATAGEVDRSVLPTPAVPTEIDTSVLPRPATPEGQALKEPSNSPPAADG